jgi:FkbM family methyltransferase
MRSIVLKNNMAVVAGRDGYFLVNLNDIYIGQGLAVYGDYNVAEAEFLRRLIKPGDTVVEVGANIGAHTLGLARAVGPQGLVHAFEPQRACFALLQAQIALNRVQNIRAYNEALGRARERVYMPSIDHAKADNFGGVALSREHSPAAEAIETATLDERFAGMPCSLIKIDVEGMEEDVVRGGFELIRTQRPLLYVENDRIEKSSALIALILELGYRLWWHIPKVFSPQNFFDVRENIFGDVAAFNMFCSVAEHEAAAGLVEIRSPDEPHPAAPPRPTGWHYTINVARAGEN